MANNVNWGGIAFCLNLFVRLLHYESTTIPSAMHSLIGLVIGLLLVFRTNTAYDRWWEGRKVIGSIPRDKPYIDKVKPYK
jgi:putative membrane protein